MGKSEVAEVMPETKSETVSMGEAARDFLATLPGEKKEASQQEINRFARWYGIDRPLAGMAGPEVASYAEEQVTASDPDCQSKIEMVRAFLAYAKKSGWTKTNLAVHLKVKRKPGPVVSKQPLPEAICLTEKGYAAIKEELATLKSQRHEVIDEMRRAAADKDFRENAPLQAARERRGHLEGRIKELEATVKLATVMENAEFKPGARANVGNGVVLTDLASGEKIRYTIVNPKETEPLKGRISSQSPIGKAVVGKCEGETVEVIAPVGKLRYRISRIER